VLDEATLAEDAMTRVRRPKNTVLSGRVSIRHNGNNKVETSLSFGAR